MIEFEKYEERKWGHEYNKENTIISRRPRGNYKRCRQCVKRYNKESRYAKGA